MAKVQKNVQSTKENLVFLLFSNESIFVNASFFLHSIAFVSSFIRDYRNEGSRSVRRLRTRSPSGRTTENNVENLLTMNENSSSMILVLRTIFE